MKRVCPNIIERTDASIDPEALSDLTEAVGWGRRSPAKWRTILSRSSYIFSLWCDTKIVGFGRIIEDGTMAMFFDIAVHPEFQRAGLGTRIMEHLMGQIRGQGFASVGLFAWDKNLGATSFYEKLGFERVSFGMKLRRDLFDI